MKNFLVLLSALFSVSATADTSTLVPQVAGWQVKPIINVGEQATNGYRMVGIPDGLGAYSEKNGVITVLMNHEIPREQNFKKGHVNGIERSDGHGGKGAFVSRWDIDVETLKVQSGQDLIKQVYLWDVDKKEYKMTSNEKFSRLCSADLAPKGTFYNQKSGIGYQSQLFLNGEEDNKTGRAFAHTLDGSTYELPHLGKIQWENVVAHPNTREKTLVIGMDDNHDGGFVVVYVGEKRKNGNPVEQAGLVGGKLYAIKKDGKNNIFELAALEDINNKTIDGFRNNALNSNASLFARPEDGAWDTQDNNVFYFATTGEFGVNTQIYKLTFTDVLKPENGGNIEVVLDGNKVGAEMFDNITVDAQGRLVIQEDPGKNEHLASIWELDPKTKTLTKLFKANPNLFEIGKPSFFNNR